MKSYADTFSQSYEIITNFLQDFVQESDLQWNLLNLEQCGIEVYRSHKRERYIDTYEATHLSYRR